MSGRGAISRLLSLLCACTTACTPLPPLPAGRELAITLAAEPTSAEVIASRRSDTSVPAAATGGVIGGSAGLAAAAACPGFSVLICAPIFLLVGGVGGAGALTLADKAANPPPDPLTQLEHKLSGFARENELQQQLLRAVRDKALAHWRLVPVSDQASMTVHLTALSLRGESPRQLSLTVMVTMTLRSAELPSYQARLPASADPKVGGAAADTGKPVPALLTRTFFYDGPTADISEWMDESGDLLKSTVALAYEAIAQRIVAALLPPSAG